GGRAEGARRLRVAVRALRPATTAARWARVRAGAGGGGRGRPPRTARLPEPRRGAGRGAHALRAAGRTDARPSPPTSSDLDDQVAVSLAHRVLPDRGCAARRGAVGPAERVL